MINDFVQLGSVAEFINGAAFKPEDWGESGLKIIRIQNLTDSNKPFNRTERIVSEKVRVQKGDLLVSWSATLGVFEWLDEEEALLNQHIFRVLPNNEKVDKRYLRHGLEGAILDMEKHLHGATMKHVNRGEFLSTNLYLPPIAEQKRIAEILDRTQSLISKRKEAIAKLDTLTQSIFIEMFGDPKTNPKNWAIKPMSSLFATSPIFGTMIPPVIEKLGWLSLRVSNIQDWSLDLSDRKYVDLPKESIERHSVKDGDLLLARAIASQNHLGKCVVAHPCGENWAFDSHLMRLRFDLDLADSDFIRHLFMTKGGRSLFLSASRKSTVQFNINTKEISSLKLPIPPISLQKEFAQRVEAVEKLKATHRASLSQLEALFASLQHRAFRGEL